MAVVRAQGEQLTVRHALARDAAQQAEASGGDLGARVLGIERKTLARKLKRGEGPDGGGGSEGDET